MRNDDPRVPDMLQMRKAGQTLQTIASAYGLSRQRVHMIFKRRLDPQDLADVPVRKNRKKHDNARVVFEMTFADGSKLIEEGAVRTNLRYGLTQPISGLLTGRSNEPIWSKFLGTYIVSAKYVNASDAGQC